MKFLIIRIGAIGDVIMTTPMVKAIKKKYPRSEISYLVGKWSMEVLENNPYIDWIIKVNEEWFLKKQFNHLKFLIQDLRKQRFDYGIALDKSWLFNLFLLLCGIKHRYGFSREHHLINKIILTKQVLFSGKKKEYEYYNDLLYTSLGLNYKYSDMALYPTKKEKSSVDKYMEEYNWKFVGIAPGGAVNPGQKALQKRWPKKYYSELINHLLLKGKKVFIIGGDGDRHYNRFPEFEGNKNYYNLTGAFNLRQTYYLLKKYCKIFITHDSGPMHLAAAAKVPKIITLFGPTQPERFAPPNAIIIKSPVQPSYTIQGKFTNKDGGMEQITVDEVINHLK